jgi:hypothetical protein
MPSVTLGDSFAVAAQRQWAGPGTADEPPGKCASVTEAPVDRPFLEPDDHLRNKQERMPACQSAGRHRPQLLIIGQLRSERGLPRRSARKGSLPPQLSGAYGDG